MATDKTEFADQKAEAPAKLTETFRLFGRDAMKTIARARQLADEKLGRASKTDMEDIETYRAAVQNVKEQTDNLNKELLSFLNPSAGFTLDQFVPQTVRQAPRQTKYSRLSAVLKTSSQEYGLATPYGTLLSQMADAYEELGNEYLSFLTTANEEVAKQMAIIKEEFGLLAAEEKALSAARLDLDAAKSESRRASEAERTESLQLVISERQQKFDSHHDGVVARLLAVAEIPASQATLLHSLTKGQLAFHQKAADVMEKLVQKMPSSSDVEWHIRGTHDSKPANRPTPNTVHSLNDHDDGMGLGTFTTFPAMAKALFDFNATNSTELSLKAGSEAEVQDRIDDDFVLCEQSGKTGRVPLAYLVPI